MCIRAERTESFGGIHRGAEDESEDVAHFVVQLFRTYFAALDHLQIGHGEIIGIIGRGASFCESVGPSAEFEVKAVMNGFVGIAHSAPI